MSNAEFLSNLFHDFGEISIDLNFALNIIIRSYRSNVDAGKVEDAHMKLGTFFSLLFTGNEEIENPRILRMKAVLSDFVVKNQLWESVKRIYEKIKERKVLSSSEIDIIDSMIGLISREAEMAFRKMRNFL